MTTTSRAHWWATLALSSVGVCLWLLLAGPRQQLPVLARQRGEENILRVAYVQDLQVDPHRRSFPFPVQNQFFLSLWEPLIECDPQTGQPQPAAAEGWEWSADRLTLTVKLRADGRWSNGEPVTARDFVRAWRRLLTQDMDVAVVLFPLKNAEAFHAGKAREEDVGVEAVDDLTLKLTLAQIRSTFVTELADPLLLRLHETTTAVLREKSYLTQPGALVTNGAFFLERATAEGFRVGASPRYHEAAKIRLAGVQFVRADGLKMAQLLLAAGSVDMMGPLTREETGPAPTERAVTKASEMALVVSTFDLNTARGPLQDLRVRKALALAMDRGGSIQPSDRATMVPAFAWVPDMPGRPALRILRENAGEARQLLAEAGYPRGEGFPVLVMPVTSTWRTYGYLQSWADRWYQELGVRIYFSYQREPLRQRDLMNGDFDLFYNGLIATVPDAGDLLNTFVDFGMYNASRWKNPAVNDLMKVADGKSGAERMALLEHIERIVMDAVPTIPTMFERRLTLLSGEVEGWYADPLGRQALKRLSIKPDSPRAFGGRSTL